MEHTPKNRLGTNKNNPHGAQFALFGTPRFAEHVLRRIIEKKTVPSFVVCNPDRPSGRKKEIASPPVKILAKKNSIPCFQPEKLDALDSVFFNEIDCFVVAAYGKIIPKDVYSLPRYGTIGIHPSVLPKYRGATPIQSALLSGDEETGVTIFVIDEKVDHGKILATSIVSIEHNDTYLTLEEKLAQIGADLLVQTLPDYISGKIIPKEQDHSRATFTKKIATDDAFVLYEDLESALGGNIEKARHINRMVRALTPEPGVWTLKDEKRMKILGTEILDNGLMLTKIQMEGKTPQDME